MPVTLSYTACGCLCPGGSPSLYWPKGQQQGGRGRSLVFSFTVNPTTITTAVIRIFGYRPVSKGQCLFLLETGLFKATFKYTTDLQGGKRTEVSNAMGASAIISV